MRIVPILVVLLAGAAAALPKVAAQDAARHRGEHVVLVGAISSVETRPDGVVLMIGTNVPVPTRVPEVTRAQLGAELADLRGREVELSGTLSPEGQPLELVLDHPEQLTDAGGNDEVRALRARVHALEQEVARMKAAAPQDLSGKTYGPTSATDRPAIQPYATEAKVLAERGIPTRTEWGPRGRVLYYGSERWKFDANGQLIGVERH